MRIRRSGSLFTITFVLSAAVAVSACTHTETGVAQAAPVAATSTAVAAAPSPSPAPMTREKASTECWMKYEKEGRTLGLDQRLSLVEKCTAEKLKTAG